METDNKTIVCKNCNNHFSGKYCNICGEKVFAEKDKSIIHLVGESFHFITHFEGTFFTTLKTIFTNPGKLSLDYCNGIRKKYFKPIPLFLLLVVLYLFFPLLDGLNMKMKYYEGEGLYGNYAHEKIQAKLQETNLTYEELAEKFHAKGEKVSKFMLLVIIPFSAILLYAISFWKRKYYFDHVVLSAELNAFYLMWGFMVFPLLYIIFQRIYFWISGNFLPLKDPFSGIIIYVVFAFYIAKAFRKFYNFKWVVSIVFTLLFCFVHLFIVYSLYKFLLFVTVINQIN